MPCPPSLTFSPPLLNSACPWATDAAHLRALLTCPSTGAVTTRTSLLKGFDHRPESHRFAFFDANGSRQVLSAGTHSYPDTTRDLAGTAEQRDDDRDRASSVSDAASLNNLGYSPLTLDDYLQILQDLARERPEPPPKQHRKTVIISITGTPEDITTCCHRIASSVPGLLAYYSLAVEINLSCPNIPGHPPPAYSADALASYIRAVPTDLGIPVGVKTPPYTHAGQFDTFITALEEAGAAFKMSFITATNTLGSCILMEEDGGAGSAEKSSSSSSSSPSSSSRPVLPGTGIGGMAGPPLHPLALGNVLTIRRLLDEKAGGLERIKIIGVGGVSDGQGYKRMRSAGASAVALATALGRHGVEVFSKIPEDLGSEW